MPSGPPASASALAAESPPDPAAHARAELLMLLAAAFAPPPAVLSTRDWCASLAADLEDLGSELALDCGAAVERLRETAAGPLAADPWLVEYSRLFLVPPVPVALNTGLYLEGGLAGVSAQMMVQCYAAAGFVPRESFRDLPDHVAMQLEFVAALVGRADDDPASLEMACEFADGFISHWIEPLCAACERFSGKHPAARVYGALGEALRRVLDRTLA
jgi:TorA maturation chaperone TorD